MRFADVILPLALPKNYTFGIPIDMQPHLQVGCRVEVQFGSKRLYSGIVKTIHDYKPEVYEVKPIRGLLDPLPIVTPQQLKFWEWLASYYACTEGEVMNAALPAYLKLESETYVVLQEGVNLEEVTLTDDEFMVLQALEIRQAEQAKEMKPK